MPKFILPLVITCTLSAQHDPKSWNSTQGWGLSQGNGILHIEAGMLVGAAAFFTARALGYGDPKADTWLKRNTKPWQHAVWWAAVAGWWKEDRDGRFVGVRGSWPDFAKTVLGGATVGVVFSYGIKPSSEAYATATPPLPEAPPCATLVPCP